MYLHEKAAHSYLATIRRRSDTLGFEGNIHYTLLHKFGRVLKLSAVKFLIGRIKMKIMTSYSYVKDKAK